ncbi:PREDICTED: C2 calcium-dependent domain-containing protein 4C-like [Nanorana parkeri]|uniref:C2 calcium-dependent domain-containing protein 4C-like n=1 Tax=Nanorana parkeri TaxID=125878 RepID=UPI000854DB82|nr:PREDICTED: C2 calcium-dependent domain-containing protein 4C-like [Nanorana parkeri]
MWLLDKLKVPEMHGQVADLTMKGAIVDKKQRPIRCPNVLTPDRIPEFCIPPLLSTPRGVRLKSLYRSVPDLSGAAFRACSTPETHIIQVDSADEPMEDESTNADPQAQAALSLPHLPKAHTSYGFCTLLESPNTRRKESLFHDDPASLSILLHRPRSLTTNCPRVSYSSFRTLKLMSLSRSGTLDSETSSSTDSSPFSSPLLHRSPPRGTSFLKAISQDRLFSRALKKKGSLSRNNSLSADECSSTDSSPNIIRRVSDGMMDSVFPMDLLYSRGSFVAENTVLLENGASMRLSTEYCDAAQRLRVRLISIEGLYNAHTDPKTINCFVALSITPGKQQKQRSTVIRRSRNPIFNEDFFFENLPQTKLQSCCLKIKTINKTFGMKRDCVLGQSELPLLSILSL